LWAVLALPWTFDGRAQAQAGDLAILHVSVIDTRDGSIHPDMTVVVAGGRIARVQKASGAKLPQSTQEVDATGKFLIPGLWDMHAHIAQDDKIQWTRPIIFPLLIANGVTGVRDMGGNFDLIQQLRREIAEQKLLGPQIVSAGPQIIGTGSEKIWPLSDWPAEGFARVGTAAEGEQLVRSLKARGVDFVKVQSQGPPIPREAYFAIAGTARKLGMPLVGHVPDSISAEEASNAGQKSIEHLTGIFLGCSTNETELRKELLQADLDPAGFHTFAVRGSFDLPPRETLETYNDAKAQKLYALLARNHTWQVPTLSIKQAAALSAKGPFFEDQRLALIPAAFRQSVMGSPAYFKRMDPHELADISITFEKSLVVVRDMRRAGVEFMAGTDLPYPPLPGSGLHDEMSLFVRAGLTPLEALQSATLNPARFLDKTEQFGTVEEGKSADLVLLDANPLADIENARKIRAVVVKGKYLSREDLDNMLRQTKAAAAEPAAH